MKPRFTKILSLMLALSLIYQQVGFAQSIQLNFSQFLGRSTPIDKFRPLHLRYFSFDPASERFNLIFDRSGIKSAQDETLRKESNDLYKYFLIGITLPNDAF